MDQPYEIHREIPMFEDAEYFNDDLARTSRRANLLAWTLTQMTDAGFRLDQNNEWFMELSSLFFEVVRNDLSKANTLSERMRLERFAERESDLARAAEVEAAKKVADEHEKMRDAALSATSLATNRAQIIGETLKQVLVDTGLDANCAKRVVKEIVDEAWNGRSIDVSEAVARMQAEAEIVAASSSRFAESAQARRGVAEILS